MVKVHDKLHANCLKIKLVFFEFHLTKLMKRQKALYKFKITEGQEADEDITKDLEINHEARKCQTNPNEHSKTKIKQEKSKHNK